MNTRDMLCGKCQQIAAGMPEAQQFPMHARQCPKRSAVSGQRSALKARCRLVRDVPFTLRTGLTARLEAGLEADVISVKGRTALIGLAVDISDIELINHPPEHVAE